jgi:hypothetical protein
VGALNSNTTESETKQFMGLAVVFKQIKRECVFVQSAQGFRLVTAELMMVVSS